MTADKDNVGYGKPPKATQFKKGKSGNPRGRPKAHKPERSLSRRQLTRDILEALDAPVAVRTPAGVVEMPTMQALIKQAAKQALGGDRITARFLHRIYVSALEDIRKDREPTFAFHLLESYEQKAARGYLAPEEHKELNELRKLSRKHL